MRKQEITNMLFKGKTNMHHLSFGKKLNKWKIWLAVFGQSDCNDHKMACKASLAWELEGSFLIW